MHVTTGRDLEAGPDALRRIVGVLDRHLEEAQREAGVDLGCDPQPEPYTTALQFGSAKFPFRYFRENNCEIYVSP